MATAKQTLELRKLLAGLLKEQNLKAQDLFDPSQNVAVVKSALELSDQEKKSIAVCLNKIFKHQVTIKNQVDPHLIAGLHIQFGDTEIDLSIKNKLTLLKEKLSAK